VREPLKMPADVDVDELCDEFIVEDSADLRN
jgi:hypothetical protein